MYHQIISKIAVLALHRSTGGYQMCKKDQQHQKGTNDHNKSNI